MGKLESFMPNAIQDKETESNQRGYTGEEKNVKEIEEKLEKMRIVLIVP